MCGIAGIYASNHGAQLEADLLAMAAELEHRGPDGVGLYTDAGFGMVNTRLSVIDLRGGDQPISDETGRYWVMQNGEIFNHVELRTELERLGHRFSTRCDTEVLVHAYEQWGAACLAKLNGDFAFAIWDRHEQELFLARDRFGVRPLFLAQPQGHLLFASEAKALLRHPATDRALDPLGIVDAFTLWSVLPDRSAFEGVRELPAGHYLHCGPDGRVEERRWWNLDFGTAGRDPLADEGELAEALRALLLDATRIRLRADVPVGVYLSGGLDSSAIAAMTHRLTGGHDSAFSLGFDASTFDESAHQERMAQALNMVQHRVTIRPADIGAHFERVVALAERPLLRTAPAPMLALSAAARDEGYKVVLTGEGADELFAGYDIFKEARIRRFCANDPNSRMRPRLFDRLYPYLTEGRVGSDSLRRRFFSRGSGDTDDPLYSHRLRFWNGARNLRFMEPAFVAEAHDQGDSLERLLSRIPAGFHRSSPLAQAQQLEIDTFLSGYLLPAQGDRMLMGNSVEGRFPFLDHRVAEFAAALPDRLRLRGLQEKYLFRKAVEPMLPAEIAGRRKRPYRAPIAAAFIGPDAPEYVAELLQPSKLAQVGVFEPHNVERLLAKAHRTTAAGLSENDSMALVGIISTMLLHEQLVARPAPRRTLTAGRVVRGGVAEMVLDD